MLVSKRHLTGWAIHPTNQDRNHIAATIDCLAPLCEVAVECQAAAVEATEALKKVQAAFPPVKPKTPKVE